MVAVAAARELARECVGKMGARWDHVRAVGQVAESLGETTELVDEAIMCAAWLHDVGYGPIVKDTGFHPLDGAKLLADRGLPTSVVSLVAYHTGAIFEAEERGLGAELAALDPPGREALDIVTMIDLSVGPTGERLLDTDRIAEIRRRYQADDPVHRAVARSRDELLASSARAKKLLGLADDWPVST
jgi:hypothetical protein